MGNPMTEKSTSNPGFSFADWNDLKSFLDDVLSGAEQVGDSGKLGGSTLPEVIAAAANSGLTVKNLVYNSDFTLYSNQSGISNWYDYKHPDGWIFTCDGTSPQIGYDSSAEACRITTPADATAMSLVQNLHEFPRWAAKLRGKQVTVHVSIQGPAGVSVTLTDGVTSDSETLEGTGSAESIDLTLTVDAAATYLRLTIASTGNTETIYLYAAYGNIGEVAIEGLPCQIDRIGLWQGMDEAYPETVMECSAASSLIEIPAGYTRLESWLNGRFGRGANSRSYLPELRGRFLRVWANGSAQDPDRATRTDRGDGTTGDKPGTLQANQNLSHNHATYPPDAHANGAGGGVQMYVYPSLMGGTGSSGGNQSNPNNINVLAGIRWA